MDQMHGQLPIGSTEIRFLPLAFAAGRRKDKPLLALDGSLWAVDAKEGQAIPPSGHRERASIEEGLLDRVAWIVRLDTEETSVRDCAGGAGQGGCEI